MKSRIEEAKENLLYMHEYYHCKCNGGFACTPCKTIIEVQNLLDDLDTKMTEQNAAHHKALDEVVLDDRAKVKQLKAKNAKLLEALRQIEAQVAPGDYDAHWSAIRMAGIASAALQEAAQCQP